MEMTSRPLNGCFICRYRKIRCDRTHPQCTSCIQLGVRCPGYDPRQGGPDVSWQDLRPLVDRIYGEAGLQRRRAGACESCYKCKSRCSKTLPACRRCMARNITCVYSNSKARSARPESVSVTSSSPTGDAEIVCRSLPDADDNQELSSHDISVELSGGTSLSSGVSISDENSWLYQADPPAGGPQLQHLVELFFSRVHPLRCLGFLYKPAWMQSLRQYSLVADVGRTLVLTVCAFGARYALEGSTRKGNCSDTPGAQWAETALDLVLHDVRRPSTTNLKAMLLLCQYSIFTGQHSVAFQLTGLSERLIRLLNLDIPDRGTPPGGRDGEIESWIRNDNNNRLVWMSYVQDCIFAAGVEQNSCWRQPPKVPLPALDAQFMTSASSPPMSPVISDTLSNFSALQDLSPRAHFVHIVRLRSHGLRLIRQESTAEALCAPNSTFLQLIADIDSWYKSLPAHLALTPLQAYALKDMNLLSLAVYLHLAYHIGITDLARVSLPGFVFPLASAFAHVPDDFRNQVQQRCRYHADEVSKIIAMVTAHGPNAFDDPFCHIAAFDASKVQIIHSALSPPLGNNTSCQAAEKNLEINFGLMHQSGLDPNKLHQRTLLALLRHFDSDVAMRLAAKFDLSDSNPDELRIASTSSAQTFYLSTVAPFRQAQTQLRVQQQSEAATSPISPDKSDQTTSVPPPISFVGSAEDVSPASRTVDVCSPTTNVGGDVPALSLPSDYHLEVQSYPEAPALDYLMWDFTELGVWSGGNLPGDDIY